MSKNLDKYIKKEADERFKKTLKAALSTPPTPLKDIPSEKLKAKRSKEISPSKKG